MKQNHRIINSTRKEERRLAKSKAEPKIDYEKVVAEEFEKMSENLILARSFFEKFCSGVKSSATKSRNALQELKKSSQVIREAIMKIKEEKGL